MPTHLLQHSISPTTLPNLLGLIATTAWCPPVLFDEDSCPNTSKATDIIVEFPIQNKKRWWIDCLRMWIASMAFPVYTGENSYIFVAIMFPKF